MRTIEQAISEETRRYIQACRVASAALLAERSGTTTVHPSSMWLHVAHVHSMAIKRLRHHVVTPHEALCAATPSVHAYADLDGYGR